MTYPALPPRNTSLDLYGNAEIPSEDIPDNKRAPQTSVANPSKKTKTREMPPVPSPYPAPHAATERTPPAMSRPWTKEEIEALQDVCNHEISASRSLTLGLEGMTHHTPIECRKMLKKIFNAGFEAIQSSGNQTHAIMAMMNPHYLYIQQIQQQMANLQFSGNSAVSSIPSTNSAKPPETLPEMPGNVVNASMINKNAPEYTSASISPEIKKKRVYNNWTYEEVIILLNFMQNRQSQLNKEDWKTLSLHFPNRALRATQFKLYTLHQLGIYTPEDYKEYMNNESHEKSSTVQVETEASKQSATRNIRSSPQRPKTDEDFVKQFLNDN